MPCDKTTKHAHINQNKKTVITPPSYSNLHPTWQFDKIDVDGHFAFNINRKDFKFKEVLSKLVEYSSMTWNQIDQQTHDRDNKSKNHFLNPDTFSKTARERINKLDLNESSDRIYSLALQNKLRIIGLRERNIFSIIWYDPDHEFSKSE